MGAIHELSEEYRHFRADRPKLRWLFLLGDLLIVLLKLVLFAAFMVACWFLIARGGQPLPSVAVQSSPSEPAIVTAELSEERIALLQEIAARTKANDTSASSIVRGVEQADTSIATKPVDDPVKGPGKEPVNELLALNDARTSVNDDGSDLIINAQDDSIADQSRSLALISSAGASITGSVANADSVIAAEPIELPRVKSDQISEEGGSDRLWVSSQPATAYTLQLALTVNRPFLVSFTRGLPDGLTSEIFPTRRISTGEIQYSLVAGSFSSRARAQEALESLPEDVRRFGAHLRLFSDVHQSLLDTGAAQ